MSSFSSTALLSLIGVTFLAHRFIGSWASSSSQLSSPVIETTASYTISDSRRAAIDAEIDKFQHDLSQMLQIPTRASLPQRPIVNSVNIGRSQRDIDLASDSFVDVSSGVGVTAGIAAPTLAEPLRSQPLPLPPPREHTESLSISDAASGFGSFVRSALAGNQPDGRPAVNSGTTTTLLFSGEPQHRPGVSDILVFVHIPKTAGSVFFDKMRKQARNLKFYPDGQHSFHDRGCGEKTVSSQSRMAKKNTSPAH